jgi:hypothetical protein
MATVSVAVKPLTPPDIVASSSEEPSLNTLGDQRRHRPARHAPSP